MPVRPAPAVPAALVLCLFAGLAAGQHGGHVPDGDPHAAPHGEQPREGDLIDRRPARPLGADLSLSAQAVDPIQAARAIVPEDVRVFDQHVSTLANPFFEGRDPRTRGGELAREYVEWYLRRAGLEPPFPESERALDGSEVLTPGESYRQAFPIGDEVVISGERLGTPRIDWKRPGFEFIPGLHFRALGYGTGGDVQAPVVFVGYGIEEGEDGYTSFEADTDLSGKIAMLLRFEPMDERGRSLFTGGQGWSRHSGLFGKLAAVAARNPAAILLVNPPRADDPRAGGIPDGGDQPLVGVPVFGLTPEVAQTILNHLGAEQTLGELQAEADRGTFVRDVGSGEVRLAAEVERVPVFAENVGGLLVGSGDLADEIIVVGAHIDHIGMGRFGSRSGPGRIHEGADDNASGTAGMLMVAEKLADAYAALPEETPRRSVLFLGFDAEESGLVGSRAYVERPIAPMENHVLMVNFDMIGRIEENRLSLSGAITGEGMPEWLEPFLAESGLDVGEPEGISGRSDHASFLAADVPVLFAMIADLHEQYHTADDEAWRINSVGAVRVVNLFARIVEEAALRPERFAFVAPPEPAGSGDSPSMGSIKVRFGIMPGNYNSSQPGIQVQGVSEGTSAALGGIKEGDRLMAWNGERILGVGEWMGMLARHEPGDVVTVTVLRDGEERDLEITLLGRSPAQR